MSDQQLTVAELLARAAKESGSSSDAPRRRRRRSLDDGGVSVAELTGSIPKVNAKPAESRHTAVPIDTPEPEPETASVQAPAPASAPAPAATPQSPTADVPSGVPISVVKEDDPVRLTTDAFPAQQQAAPVVQPEPVQPEPVQPEPVRTEPASAAVPTTPTQDVTETAVIPVVPDRTTNPVVAEAAAPANTPDVAYDEPADYLDDEDADEGVSMLSVIVMAVLGILLGIGLFIGFKILWASVTPILVAIMALAMTLGLVGVVHALRTERDGMSMALAGLTGLAVTFGPMLVANL